MSKYDQAVDKLVQAIQKHDSVQEFQKVEQKIKTFPELDSLVDDMKDYRNKMQDASDLVQYITKNLETKINEELTNNDKR